MMKVLTMLAVGLIGGVVIGFVLGREYSPRCLACAYGAEGQYRRGLEDGWTDCAKTAWLELDRLIGETLTAEKAAGITRRLGGEGTVDK